MTVSYYGKIQINLKKIKLIKKPKGLYIIDTR